MAIIAGTLWTVDVLHPTIEGVCSSWSPSPDTRGAITLPVGGTLSHFWSRLPDNSADVPVIVEARANDETIASITYAPGELGDKEAQCAYQAGPPAAVTFRVSASGITSGHATGSCSIFFTP